MASAVSVWCIGPCRFVKEIAALVDTFARVRWIADSAALDRNLVTSACETVVVEHSADGVSLGRLQAVQARLPDARRLVVVDACELKVIRSYLDVNAATEILYRPLDRATVLRLCGIARPASASKSRLMTSRAW